MLLPLQDLNPIRRTPVVTLSLIAVNAICFLWFAYAVTWPWARVRTLVFLLVFITVMELPALLVLGVWFVGQLLEARQQLRLGLGGGVAWWAHVGGFITGAVLMPFLSMLEGSRPDRFSRAGALEFDQQPP